MATANTVPGPIDTNGLGFTHRILLSHDYSVPKARHGAEVQEQRWRLIASE